MAHTKEQHQAYMKTRYHQLRPEWISQLGGECVRC